LPSFHYEAAAGEMAPGALRLPWSDPAADSRNAVGVFARDHGAAVPGRLVVSAKSWLSHSGVDRTAGLLPWHGAPDVQRLSPVEASARYLAHVRQAWDAAHPEHPLARQDVILTVPASFDEVARELTLEAARTAGLVRIVLLEEPQAAFYAWINAHRSDWDRRVRAGQTILVCDIGGGTSDFTLIRVRPGGGGNERNESDAGRSGTRRRRGAAAKTGDADGAKVIFHRVAVGEHLILGGDNLDLALAHHIERRLASDPQSPLKLSPQQFGPLVRSCRAAKETLLGNDPPPRLTLNIAAGGSRLIGGARQVEVTREEVQTLLLDGFLPRVALTDKPLPRRSGFQEFGLPYAPDHAITRYLAAFLAAHRQADANHGGDERAALAARPDLVLFNGGLFESPAARQRLLEVLATWFPDRAPDPSPTSARPASKSRKAARPSLAPSRHEPIVLRNDRLDLAVARGAAYFGMVRRGAGVRISGGLAHSYYIGVTSSAAGESAAVCLLPVGVEEDQTIDLTDRTFDLLIRQPAEFPLYVSSTRTTDPPGALVAIDREQMSPLPPIRTVLQSGRRSGDVATVPVHLHARLTPVGTLEVWCTEVRGNRTWKLQFDVRSATRAEVPRHESAAEGQGIVDEQLVEQCRAMIRATFSRRGGGCAGPEDKPERLVKRIEQATSIPRQDWPASFMRGLWETLMEVEPSRQLSVEHEARWLNLTGFCLRPGYGLAVDDWRVAQTWRLHNGPLYNHRNELCRAEWWILWRRLAGGLSAAQQQILANPLAAAWRTYARKGGVNIKWNAATFQFGPHESAEAWRLLGALELLAPDAKTELGALLLSYLSRASRTAVREACFAALGRFGARVPQYGPLNDLVPVDVAEAWARQVIDIESADDGAAFAVVQLTRRTGDRYRDVSDELRQRVLDWLAARAAPAHYLELVREGGHLQADEQRIVFGDALPRGLSIG
jgi:hypothetical protein